MASPVLTLSPRILLQQVGEEMVAMDTITGHYFEINAVGTAMIQSLMSGNSFDEIVAQLLLQFDVAKEELVQDLNEWIEKLRSKGFLSESET